MFDDPFTPAPPAPAPTETEPVSPALNRFRSCRWSKLSDDTSPLEHCTHRDVLPMAGTTGFNAEAWCPDCAAYKLRRTPKKRPQY
jgi:hypothetical protein